MEKRPATGHTGYHRRAEQRMHLSFSIDWCKLCKYIRKSILRYVFILHMNACRKINMCRDVRMYSESQAEKKGLIKTICKSSRLFSSLLFSPLLFSSLLSYCLLSSPFPSTTMFWKILSHQQCALWNSENSETLKNAFWSFKKSTVVKVHFHEGFLCESLQFPGSQSSGIALLYFFCKFSP